MHRQLLLKLMLRGYRSIDNIRTDYINKTIVDYSIKTPTNNTSPYYYDGRNAIGTQIQNIIQGADVDSAIADAQAEVEFTMSE